jgi:alpha-mannosidase
MALLAGDDPRAPRDAELGLQGVLAGDDSAQPATVSLLALEPRELLLSACKPAESGGGIVVRVLNPTDRNRTAVLRLAGAVDRALPVRLDEEPAPELAATVVGGAVRFEVPPHALRSVRIE